MTDQGNTVIRKKKIENVSSTAKRSSSKFRKAIRAKIAGAGGLGFLGGIGAGIAIGEIPFGKVIDPKPDDPKSDDPISENGSEETNDSKATVEEKAATLASANTEYTSQRTANYHTETHTSTDTGYTSSGMGSASSVVDNHGAEVTGETTTAGTDDNIEYANESFFRDHKVIIDEVDKMNLSNGSELVSMYGTVDGVNAVILTDSDGNLIAGFIDSNGNGELDSEELFMFEENMSLPVDMVALNINTAPVDDDFHITEVVHDINFGDTNVDAAIVTYKGTKGVLIDVDQDGKADLIAFDFDQDGEISENEIAEVTDTVKMPTSPDIDDNLIASTTTNVVPTVYTTTTTTTTATTDDTDVIGGGDDDPVPGGGGEIDNPGGEVEVEDFPEPEDYGHDDGGNDDFVVGSI